MELVDADRGFFAEGRVARVHKVALALRHVQQPGVGVRFLSPEDLIAELVPGARAPAVARPRAVPAEGDAAGSEDAPEAGATESAGGAAEPGGDAGPGPSGTRAGDTDAATDGLEVVPADFVDASSFLSVYHRDIASGGLFLSTSSPAQLDELIVVELRIPGIAGPPPRFRARVVQRIEPQAAVGRGRNLLAGMGVQFLERERVIESLRPVLAELRR